jgi:hypothetical protein
LSQNKLYEEKVVFEENLEQDAYSSQEIFVIDFGLAKFYVD